MNIWDTQRGYELLISISKSLNDIAKELKTMNELQQRKEEEENE